MFRKGIYRCREGQESLKECCDLGKLVRKRRLNHDRPNLRYFCKRLNSISIEEREG